MLAKSTPLPLLPSCNIFQDQLKIAAAIVDLFHRIPSASARFIELLCKLVLTTEKALAVEPGSLLRDPLRRYLSRYQGRNKKNSRGVDLYVSRGK